MSTLLDDPLGKRTTSHIPLTILQTFQTNFSFHAKVLPQSDPATTMFYCRDDVFRVMCFYTLVSTSQSSDKLHMIIFFNKLTFKLIVPTQDYCIVFCVGRLRNKFNTTQRCMWSLCLQFGKIRKGSLILRQSITCQQICTYSKNMLYNFKHNQTR